MPLTIELTQSPTDDARLLVSELDAVLHADSPPENRHGLPIERIFQPHISFFIARLDNLPVGCGGVSFENPAHAEVKRMYVRPEARGRDVAQSLLARIEHEARSRKSPRLVLETGTNRHAAIRFYQRSGFTPTNPFPPYTTMPPHAIAQSVFFEKTLP
jgi:putative acetyltransferase